MFHRAFVLLQMQHFMYPKYRWGRNGRFHHAHPSSFILLYPIRDTTLLQHKDECWSFLRELHISTVCSKWGIWFTHSIYDFCLTLWHLSSQSSCLYSIVQHLNLRSTIQSRGRQIYIQVFPLYSRLILSMVCSKSLYFLKFIVSLLYLRVPQAHSSIAPSILKLKSVSWLSR